MITNKEAKWFLQAFLNGDAPFDEIRQRVGHASSSASDVFFNWLSLQSGEDRAVITDTLVECVLFDDEFVSDLRKVMALLVDIAVADPSAVSAASKRQVERFILRGDRLSVWLNDEESEDDDQKDLRSRWRFALGLWNMVWAIGSPAAEQVFETVVQRARDPEFVRAITLAKSVREHPPFGI